MRLCIAVTLTGVAITISSAVAFAGAPPARGGQAVPVTSKAPLLQKQKRGWIGAVVAGSPSKDGLARP